MNATDRASKFIAHALDFHQDLDLPDIDEKHLRILTELYSEIEKGVAFNRNNICNWKAQSDNGSQAQLQL